METVKALARKVGNSFDLKMVFHKVPEEKQNLASMQSIIPQSMQSGLVVVEITPDGLAIFNGGEYPVDGDYEPEECYIPEVGDGDTCFVEGLREYEDHTKVRSLTIDTPESKQSYYKKATDEFKKWVLKKRVILQRQLTDMDIHGRLLRDIYIDGVHVNEAMVTAGLAVIYPFQPDIRYLTQLRNAEKNARMEGRGFWKIFNK